MKTTDFFKYIAVLLIFVESFSCKKWENAELFTENGIVKYISGPDTCDDYMILIKQEKSDLMLYYKPNNLPENFKEDNLYVNVKFSISEKKHNCGFGGYVSVIYIIKIQKQ
ncbi:MAG: hypothetical protein FWH18_03005 [Marinilabiliaceae bacterium]|nr:hypothetical protein [Marinilabiliaceae bacterium]